MNEGNYLEECSTGTGHGQGLDLEPFHGLILELQTCMKASKQAPGNRQKAAITLEKKVRMLLPTEARAKRGRLTQVNMF